mmetsp:Transcript_5267/g.7416  ORF Transcript_5267/g.7416 Transcript_5267/m.7416 type:complete len:265 (+) Transcript_5267:1531-2325(+)
MQIMQKYAMLLLKPFQHSPWLKCMTGLLLSREHLTCYHHNNSNSNSNNNIFVVLHQILCQPLLDRSFHNLILNNSEVLHQILCQQLQGLSYQHDHRLNLLVVDYLRLVIIRIHHQHRHLLILNQNYLHLFHLVNNQLNLLNRKYHNHHSPHPYHLVQRSRLTKLLTPFRQWTHGNSLLLRTKSLKLLKFLMTAGLTLSMLNNSEVLFLHHMSHRYDICVSTKYDFCSLRVGRNRNYCSWVYFHLYIFFYCFFFIFFLRTAHSSD